MRRFASIAVAVAAISSVSHAQEGAWVSQDGGNTALVCTTDTTGDGLCFFTICSGGQAIMGVSYTDGPALAPSGELRADIGRLSYLIGLRDASTAKAQQFIAPLYEGEGSRMVDALMSGSSASLTIDTVEGQIRHNITLNGSARAMRPVLKACPDPDPEWDPSDAPVRSTNQPSAGAELVSDRNEIAQTFLRQDCVATESELFEAVRQRWGSIGDAQVALRIWGESPGFSDDYEILKRDPFTYRWTAGPCANSLQRAATGPSASSQGARDRRIAEAIDRACWRDDGGTMDRGIYTPDLDGDGRDDLVLDHVGITCSQGYLPQTCGAQVCETQIFFGSNGGYREGHTMLNSVTEVVPGTPPGLRIIGHGGTEGVVRWNGREFAVR